MNLVLTLCDPGDSVVVFAPYYFNAFMSFQTTGITNILVGHCNPETLHPDAGEKLHDLVTTIYFYRCGLVKRRQYLVVKSIFFPPLHLGGLHDC